MVGAWGVFLALALAWLASSVGYVGSVTAAQKTATSPEAGLGSSRTQALPLPSQAIAPTREVEIVVVWGFRIRTTEHDLRVQSLLSGYDELIKKADCMTAVCGFVVVQDGTKWRATNVIAATVGELQDMQRNMERENTVLVIVHPNGARRALPKF